MTPRIVELDALRGFALLGIALGNVMWFSGYAVADEAQRVALGTAALDEITAFALTTLVDGKFYGLFSLLFGASFVELARRHDRRGAPGVVARRLGALLLIGMLHAGLLWFGDILGLYAVAAVPLWAVHRWPTRRLLRLAVASLLAPIAIYAGLLVAEWLTAPGPGAQGHGPASLLPAFATGDYAALLDANTVFLRERWILALRSGRLLRIFGFFVLGVVLLRERPSPSDRSVRGLVVAAVLGNLLLAGLHDVPLRPATSIGLVRELVYSLAVPLGCLAYVAVLWRMLGRPSRLAVALAHAGRLSLSHYLGQSLVMAAIFYGVGFGLWGELGATAAVVVAGSLATVQIALSGAWRRRFGAGPAERALRALIGTGRPDRR